VAGIASKLSDCDWVKYVEQFETVVSTEENHLLIWNELVTFDSFISDYDAQENIPCL